MGLQSPHPFFIESIFQLWPKSEHEEQSIFLFTPGPGLSITPVSGQTEPSHELPQTHLQKIRHEIVWLLHHRGHLPPAHHHPPHTFLSFLHEVHRGSTSAGRVYPAGCPATAWPALWTWMSPCFTYFISLLVLFCKKKMQYCQYSSFVVVLPDFSCMLSNFSKKHLVKNSATFWRTLKSSPFKILMSTLILKIQWKEVLDFPC